VPRTEHLVDRSDDLPVPLSREHLPAGVRARFVETRTGLRAHVLEAGSDRPGAPLLLLLHGFPELAFSWRQVMGPLGEAGFHVVAPDQRGYGRTTGWNGDYDGDWQTFRLLSVVRDSLALVRAIGHDRAEAVVGHDFGSPVAALCALIRPDVFKRVVMMSAPFAGIPDIPAGEGPGPARLDIDRELARLDPPRKHYQRYYSTRQADEDMRNCVQGLHDFLRAYFHMKSGDWPGNEPFPLAAWTADELAKMPRYYIMDLDQTMAETVAPAMPTPDVIGRCQWLPDEELAVYTEEFGRTGFQGGLQWYRCAQAPSLQSELLLFTGRHIEVPAAFIAGARDWGVHQAPGALGSMQNQLCTDFRSLHLLDGAGHWVQQERSDGVATVILDFLRSSSPRAVT
jgi:pimeloyl-ACP methyl ester carboxylesterase